MKEESVIFEILKKKFTYRKFLVALIAVIIGVVGVCGGNDNVIEAVTVALTALIPTIIYIITEGRIDAAAVGQIADTAGDIADGIAKDDWDMDDPVE